MRRLAADHSALHTTALPPHYLFPPSSDSNSIPDDLTQLTVLLTGPTGTPYSQGLWKLHLKIPEDFPKSPPKASFRTRIWHPNVEEATGSVCVDTLKRDWQSKLTLKDVLIVSFPFVYFTLRALIATSHQTISCLLIQPNPDSALNSAAGQLLQDDYEAFARQAKLMTSIHAAVPSELREAALAAKRRGEEAGTKVREDTERSRPTFRKASSSSSQVIMKRRPHQLSQCHSVHTSETPSTDSAQPTNTRSSQLQTHNDEPTDDENDETSASKENDPSLSPSPVVSPAFPSPRKNILGKRPLSALPTPIDPDMDAEDEANDLSPSERNIANNNPYFPDDYSQPHPLVSRPRKSPKLAERSREVNSSSSEHPIITPFEDQDATTATLDKTRVPSDEYKENVTAAGLASTCLLSVVKKGLSQAVSGSGVPGPAAATRNISTASTASNGSGKGVKPRIGLRRL